MDESVKTLERQSLNRIESQKELERPKPKPKEGKSTFDELLDQSRRLSQGLSDPKNQAKTETKNAVPETQRFKERDREKSKDSDDKEEQKQEGNREKRDAEGADKKVVGKAGLKQSQGDAHGGGSREGGTGSRKGERPFVNLKSFDLTKGPLHVGSQEFVKELQLAKGGYAIPKTLPQDVVNQIIRYAKVGQTRDGSHLFELECHQEVFRGLRLRIQAKNGKVNVEFLTANEEIRKLFVKEGPKLKIALQAKGIAVETITVA